MDNTHKSDPSKIPPVISKNQDEKLNNKVEPNTNTLDAFLSGVVRAPQIDNKISFEVPSRTVPPPHSDANTFTKSTPSTNENQTENASNLKNLSNVMRKNNPKEPLAKIITPTLKDSPPPGSTPIFEQSIKELISRTISTEIKLTNVLKSKTAHKVKKNKHVQTKKDYIKPNIQQSTNDNALNEKHYNDTPAPKFSKIKTISSSLLSPEGISSPDGIVNKNNFASKNNVPNASRTISKNDLSSKSPEEVQKKLYQKALWMCSKSEQLSNNLSQKLLQTLKNWNVFDEQSNQTVDSIVLKLKKLGYVDDLRFCKMFIKNKISKKSLKSCLFELSSKGVSKDILTIAQDEFSAENNPISERTQIYLIWKKKFGLKPMTDKDKNKQMRYFASRGFELKVLFDIWKNPQNFIDFD